MVVVIVGESHNNHLKGLWVVLLLLFVMVVVVVGKPLHAGCETAEPDCLKELCFLAKQKTVAIILPRIPRYTSYRYLHLTRSIFCRILNVPDMIFTAGSPVLMSQKITGRFLYYTLSTLLIYPSHVPPALYPSSVEARVESCFFFLHWYLIVRYNTYEMKYIRSTEPS